MRHVAHFLSPKKMCSHWLPHLCSHCQAVRDEDTVRKALRVAWNEGAHPDEKDAEFLSRLRDWLGEDEALTLGHQL